VKNQTKERAQSFEKQDVWAESGQFIDFSMQCVSVWSICFKWLFMGNLVCTVPFLWKEYWREKAGYYYYYYYYCYNIVTPWS